MVSSISNTATDSIQQMMAAMFQKMNQADTDGTTGLSKSELSSIDSTDDVGGSAFLKSLSKQFDSLDTDGNGQLSAEEISAAKPVNGPMGPPPGLDLGSTEKTDDSSDTTEKASSTDSTASTDSTSSTDSTESILEKLLAKLLESFADSYSKSDSSDEAKDAVSALSKSDTDGKSGLSIDELTSIDTGNDSTMSSMVQDLKNNFSTLDKDGDGQLSKSEIKDFFSSGKMSEQEMAKAAETDGSSELADSFANLTSSFVQKLMSSYTSGGLSTLASSLSIAV